MGVMLFCWGWSGNEVVNCLQGNLFNGFQRDLFLDAVWMMMGMLFLRD